MRIGYAIVVPTAEWCGHGLDLTEQEKAAWVAQFEPAPRPRTGRSQ